jgi:hypothetical protein
MTPETLFLIASNPHASHRPAEGVRIAAGVAAWKKTRVRLYLHGDAVRCLDEWAEELVDGDNFPSYLPILRDLACPVGVQAGAPGLADLAPTLKYTELSESDLKKWVAEATFLLRF